jgi:hypothetical protein
LCLRLAFFRRAQAIERCPSATARDEAWRITVNIAKLPELFSQGFNILRALLLV